MSFKELSLFKPVKGFQLGVFRIVLGLVYLVFFSRLVLRKKFTGAFIKTDFHFAYDWLFPLPELPDLVLIGMMGGLIVASVLVLLNIGTRFAFLYIFFAFGYFFFLEKALYNNHYFILVLIAFWGFLVFDRSGPIDPRREGHIAHWKYLILKAQFLLVYFYGGIAKFNSEWLKGNTVRALLDIRFPELNPELILSLAGAMTYGGILFDLSVPFLLLYKPTRKLAFLFVVLFNVTNHVVFEIGIFPFLMMGSLILFLDHEKVEGETIAPPPAWVKWSAILLIVIQMLIPFRHVLYPGNVVWTEEGYFFSWRMISSVKKVKAQFRIVEPGTGRIVTIDPRRELNSMQYHAMGRYPELALQYAKHLKALYQQKGFVDPIVNGKIQVKMNKRPYTFVFDPELDLGSLDHRPLRHIPEILPN